MSDATATQKLSPMNLPPMQQANTAPKARPLPRTEALIAADKTINGDRQADYGDAQTSFNRIALLWSAILGFQVEAREVALCMAAVKISRAVGKPDHADSYVDLLGYGALAAELSGIDLGQQA